MSSPKPFSSPLRLLLLLTSLSVLANALWSWSKPLPPQPPPELAPLVSVAPLDLPKPVEEALAPPPPPAPPRYLFPSGTLPNLPPAHLSGDEKYAYYEALCEEMGVTVQEITVIGLRGLNPDRKRHPSTDNATNYDDTFVILKPATREVHTFLGSTHAGQPTSTLSPGGVAQIKPGFYRADPCGDFAGMPCWLVTTRSGEERIPCWRDANGDGVIGPAELRQSSTATEILFHNGRYQEYGSSIGCQVLPPSSMERFIDLIGVSNSFDYLLIDANRPFS